ncbi:hypothetical protein [Meridianimarinicoccus roseus]
MNLKMGVVSSVVSIARPTSCGGCSRH